MKLTNARIILPDGILNSASLRTENGRIAEIEDQSETGGAVDLKNLYLAPGFVDIHCHGSGAHWFFDAPAEAARWHLMEGTTSLLCSLWRNAGTYSYRKAVENVKSAMGPDSNIRGIHMEGPYLDPDLGCEGGKPWPVDPEEYAELMRVGKGVIRTWTFDPTQPGAEDFARAAQAASIRLAVCYSKASTETLKDYMRYGLSIGSHIYCATSAPKPRFAGTKEPGSDVFVLCEDGMTAELIADSMGGHVRPYYLKLTYKCKGADGIALVSDCCAGGDTMGSDVNIIGGELYGSRLTLSVAIRNMHRHTGAGMVELMRMASGTPAKAIGLYGEIGSIASGKRADLTVLDDDLRVRGVILNGEFVRHDF